MASPRVGVNKHVPQRSHNPRIVTKMLAKLTISHRLALECWAMLLGDGAEVDWCLTQGCWLHNRGSHLDRIGSNALAIGAPGDTPERIARLDDSVVVARGDGSGFIGRIRRCHSPGFRFAARAGAADRSGQRDCLCLRETGARHAFWYRQHPGDLRDSRHL